ncbi:MAG TPA: hypothetical protein VJM33_06645 [Microthrixaceae bacterium]|nr:hypothetical protein [Microthrixaceae bacterium]
MSTQVTTLVVLHGYDSQAIRAAELARELDPDRHWDHHAPEGPLVVTGGGRAWFDVEVDGSLAGSIKAVREVVDHTSANGVEPDGVVVVGYSQGAAAALAALATTGAPRIGRLVCMSGFVVDGAGLEYDWSQLAETAVLLVHGEQDDVVPSFFSEDLATLLVDAGIDVTHQTFPIGHDRSPEEIDAVRAWLTG